MTGRSCFLRDLPRHGFAPPAADALVPGNPAAAFASDVAAFAAAFWAQPPADRRARWEALTVRAAGPAAAWLCDLGDALDLTPTAHADAAAAELASAVRELVVLPPRARADRRRTWLAAEPERFAARRRAARAVIRADLPLARLEPTLFDYLATAAPPGGVAGTPGARWGLLGLRRAGVRRVLFWAVVFAFCCYVACALKR